MYYFHLSVLEKFKFQKVLALIAFTHLFIFSILAVGPEVCEMEHDRSDEIHAVQQPPRMQTVAPLMVEALSNTSSTIRYARFHARRVQNTNHFTSYSTHVYLVLNLFDESNHSIPIYSFPESGLALMFIQQRPVQLGEQRQREQSNSHAELYYYDFMKLSFSTDPSIKLSEGLDRKGPYICFETDFFTIKDQSNPVEALISKKMLYPVQHWPLKERNIEGLFKKIQVDSIKSLNVDEEASPNYFKDLLSRIAKPSILKIVRLFESNASGISVISPGLNNSRCCGKVIADFTSDPHHSIFQGRRLIQDVAHTKLSYISELLTSCCQATNLRFTNKFFKPLVVRRFLEEIIGSGSSIENDIARHAAPDMSPTSRFFYNLYLFITQREIR